MAITADVSYANGVCNARFLLQRLKVKMLYLDSFLSLATPPALLMSSPQYDGVYMSRNARWEHILEACPSSGTSYCFGITRLVLLIKSFKL